MSNGDRSGFYKQRKIRMSLQNDFKSQFNVTSKMPTFPTIYHQNSIVTSFMLGNNQMTEWIYTIDVLTDLKSS
jgi:hypothetical protein